MKKKILCTLAIISMMSTSAFAAGSFALNGKNIGDVAEIEGNTYLPVRVLAEALELDVEWNSETKSVVISNGGPLYITFTIGENGYTFAKTAPMPLSGAPVIVDNKAYIPADAITDLFAYEVEKKDNVLNIITESPVSVGEGTVEEINEKEILFNDDIKGEVRLALSDSIIIKDSEGNDAELSSVKEGSRLTVEYGEAMTMSLPPLNNPVSIIVQ